MTELMEWLATSFRPTLIRPVEDGGVGWCKNDCIRTAKMVIRLLKELGVKSREISVTALIANQPCGLFLKPLSLSLSQIKREHVPRIKDLRMVRFGGTPPYIHTSGSWRGHLVVVAEERFLIDLSIDSVNDPAQRFCLDPIAVEIGPENVATLDDDRYTFDLDMPTGEMVSYRHAPDNHEYFGLQAWTAWSDFHEQIIRQAKQAFLNFKKT